MKKSSMPGEAGIKCTLVTGASGFIGRVLCRKLQSQGCFVHALLRTSANGPWNNVIQTDLGKDFSLSLPSDIEIVFHLAGKAHALSETRHDEEEYFQINVEGTRKLLEAAQQAGVKRFIYFSSVKAVGDVDGVMDESVSRPVDTPYGRSKYAAEKLVLEGGHVPHPVVIRPSMVYGNTEKGNLPRMIRAIEAGRFPPLPDIGTRRSMVHVDDVVHAAILAAERSEAAGQTYIVTDGQAYSTRQIYDWICEALDKEPISWSVPMPILKLFGFIGDAIGKVRGRRFMFDSDALDSLMGSALYSSEKIARELGYRPTRDLHAALPEIVEYLHKAHHD